MGFPPHNSRKRSAVTLHWYEPPTPSAETLPAYLEHLHPIGVRWHDWPSAPGVTYQLRDGELIAEIGAITVYSDNEVVSVWPYKGLGVAEQMVLAASAQQAWEQPPTLDEGWAQSPAAPAGWRVSGVGGRPRWTTYILVPVDADGAVGRLVARHQHRITTEVTAALQAAIGAPDGADAWPDSISA